MHAVVVPGCGHSDGEFCDGTSIVLRAGGIGHAVVLFLYDVVGEVRQGQPRAFPVVGQGGRLARAVLLEVPRADCAIGLLGDGQLRLAAVEILDVLTVGGEVRLNGGNVLHAVESLLLGVGHGAPGRAFCLNHQTDVTARCLLRQRSVEELRLRALRQALFTILDRTDYLAGYISD